jgi:hypothetical protein
MMAREPLGVIGTELVSNSLLSNGFRRNPSVLVQYGTIAALAFFLLHLELLIPLLEIDKWKLEGG